MSSTWSTRGRWTLLLVRTCAGRFISRRFVFVTVLFLFVFQIAPFFFSSSSSSNEEPDECDYFLGRELIVDDRGRLCPWFSQLWTKKNGCCSNLKRFENNRTLSNSVESACRECSSFCCSQYETCVSCCVVSKRAKFASPKKNGCFSACLESCRFSSHAIEGISFKPRLRGQHFCYR